MYSRMGNTSVFFTTEIGNDLHVQIISYNLIIVKYELILRNGAYQHTQKHFQQNSVGLYDIIRKTGQDLSKERTAIFFPMKKTTHFTSI